MTIEVNRLSTIDLNEAQQEQTNYGSFPVLVSTAGQGEKIDISDMISTPEEFYGDPHVDQLVQFGGAFGSLIGKHDKKLNWNIDNLPGKGIFIAEYYSAQAKKLVRETNRLAQWFVRDKNSYDDRALCQEYFDLAKEGYEHLAAFTEDLNLHLESTIPVSFERAGLVSTRLAMGLDVNAVIPEEIRVVTKRTHIKGEPETHLSVSVNWRDEGAVDKIEGAEISINDFVNPASGASTGAFVLAAREKGAVPRRIIHRAIMATQQGILYNARALRSMGIGTIFCALGQCDTMNDHYYLTGKAVGDAGHALRHFLPEWYRQ